MKTGTMTLGTLWVTAATTTLLLVTGCAKPFTADVLAEANDETPPVLTIDSPEDESYYAKTVAVSGSVSDSTGSGGVPGYVQSVVYEIPAASVREQISFDENGSFSFQFSTATYTGDTISVRVVAADRNGNETAVSLTLLYGGSDIASFEAVPGNQQVTLQWEPVPGSGGYTVRNLGTSEEVTLGSGASSYTWPDLENGEQYFFQLESSDGLGQTNLSSEVTGIPLSPYTLMPRAESDADGVTLWWRDMAGVETYVVEKSESPDGPYLKRFVTSATTAEDSLLARDRYYYYRVYPEGQEAVKSAPVEAILLPYSEAGSDTGDYLGPYNSARNAIAYGDYIFIDDSPARGEYVVRVIDASDPSRLTEVDSLSLTASVYDFAVDPVLELLFVSLEEQGVAVIDVANPSAPQLLPNSDTDGALPDERFLGSSDDAVSFSGIETVQVGGLTYVTGVRGGGEVYTAEVTVAAGEVTFTPTDSYIPADTGTEADAMALYGTDAYIAVNDSAGVGYDIIDLSAPATGISRSQGYRDSSTTADQAPEAIAVNEDYVFIGYRTDFGSTASGIRTIDRSFESSIAEFLSEERIEDLHVAAEVLYASVGTEGVLGFDVDLPPDSDDPPVVVPDVAGSAQAALIASDYLLVAALTGVESFDLLPLIEGSSVRVQIGSGYGRFSGFASLGDQALFTGPFAVYRADIGDPTTLGSLTTVSTVDEGSGLILQGDRVLLPVTTASVETLRSISAPAAADPQVLGSVDHNSSRFFSIGDVTYGFRGTTLSVFDTSDSSEMVRLQSFALSEPIVELVVRGDYLYGAYYDADFSRDSGIIVLDISDPLRPQEVAKIPATNVGANYAFHDIAISGDRLYLPFSDNGGSLEDGTDDASGLVVYSFPSNSHIPTLAGDYVGEGLDSGDPAPVDWSWTRRFELIEVQGYLAVLSSGVTARKTGNTQLYEGRIVLLNVADPSNIYKIKDILAEDADPYSASADLPREIFLWKGRHLFVGGEQQLSVFEL